jgi:probable F420-dependent oxidoreductase
MTTADRKFRFGVVAAMAPDAQAWTKLAQRAEELGYSTLMMPDTPGTFALSALGAAAAVTSKLRVGNHVLNVSLRTPQMTAWEALSLDVVSGGRFEVGLGTGRAPDDAERLGLPFGTPGERLARLADTIAALKQGFAKAQGPRPTPDHHPYPAVQQPHPPILVAAGGKRALTLAAEQADIVTFAIPADTTEEALVRKAKEFHEIAGDRLDQIELALNISWLGDDVPDWMLRMMRKPSLGIPVSEAAAFLTGTPQQMADTLLRRREDTGISYVMVNGQFINEFAPVVEQLAGT